MRFHTNAPIGQSQIIEALASERKAGRIAPHVHFKTCTAHRSTTHLQAFEIQLEADVRDRGRRAGNSGSYGAMQPEVDGYTATFDEWGWLIEAIYALTQGEGVWGSVKYPQYTGADHFLERTGWTYDPELAWQIEHHGDPAPYVHSTTNRIGRRGVGRSDDSRYAVKHDPRTAEWARKFYAGEII